MEEKPTRARRKEQTREHLFEESLRLFRERGFAEVKVEDIVRASGVARGTFYFHFPTKEDVLLELLRRGEQRMEAGLRRLAPESRLREALQYVTTEMAGYWRDDRDLLPFAGGVALRNIAASSEERAREPVRHALGELVDSAIARGELRSLLPGQMLADIFLLNALAGLITWAGTEQADLEAVMYGVTELFLKGAEGFHG